MFIASAGSIVPALRRSATEKCSGPTELGQQVRRGYKYFASAMARNGQHERGCDLIRRSFSL